MDWKSWGIWKKKKLENINCETIIDDNRKETEQHNEVVGTSDVLAVESVEDLQLGGMVSSERWGGKYMRTCEGSERPFDPFKS